MDYRFIFEYARRQQLAALDDFVGKQLALDDFDPNQLAGGKVDGKLYGISLGANSVTYVYNQALLEKLGVTLPDPTTWTNEDFEKIGKQVKDQLPEGMYLVQNMGYWEPRLENWVRQRGKSLYTEDGQLGYELEDLTDFFAYWKDLQDKGLTPPADVRRRTRAGKMEDSMFVTGKSLFGGTHSNQLVANQKLVPDEINITMIPNQKGGKPGQYLKPSMLLSIAETSRRQGGGGRAAELLHHRPRGQRHPADRARRLRRRLGPRGADRRGLYDTEKKIIDYLDIVATSVGPLPPPPPKNAGELDRALRPTWDAIAFGKIDAGGRRQAVLRQRGRDPRARLSRRGHGQRQPTADGSAPPTLGDRLRRAWRRNGPGYLFLLPWLIGFLGLTLGPTLASLYLSFTDYDLLTPPRWAGLKNYQYAFFMDQRLGNALTVTFTYVLWSVPLKLAAALGLAMVLDRSVRGVALLPRHLLPAVAPRRVGRHRRALAADLRGRGAGQPVPRDLRHPRAGLGVAPGLCALDAGGAGDLAVRLADDHLPRRPPADPAGPLRGGLDGRRLRAGGSSGRSRCRCSRR